VNDISAEGVCSSIAAPVFCSTRGLWAAARFEERDPLSEYLHYTGGLRVEFVEIDTVGGGKTLDDILGHVGPTAIGEDSERRFSAPRPTAT
jgi:hypothetical protein